MPVQNAFGGFVYAGGTMAFTAGYWALGELKPDVMAFLGCDMNYSGGNTHFYGKGEPDPLRNDVTLQSLEAKSARLMAFAAMQNCVCVNLSEGRTSRLIFPRSSPQLLSGWGRECFTPFLNEQVSSLDLRALQTAQGQEERLGYMVESGRYWEVQDRFDAARAARGGPALAGGGEGGLERRFQIRAAEIIPLEQKWQAQRFGERVGITVAHIERGGVPAFAEPVKRGHRRFADFRIDRRNGDAGFLQQVIQYHPRVAHRTGAHAHQSRNSFKDGGGGGDRRAPRFQRVSERRRLRLAQQQRDKRRSVDGDHRSPDRSSKNALSALRPVCP